MTEELSKEHGFYLPTLSVNMRNSHEIAELSKAVKPESSFHKIKQDIIDILSTQKSSVLSTKPRVIPIEHRNLGNHLKQAIKMAIDGKKTNVFLYNDRNRLKFNPDDIKKQLLECGIKEEDILCHSVDSNNTKEDIKAFLLNPDGILICQDECFIGMESYSVVYFVADTDSGSNLRCHLMRASSELDVVYAFGKDDFRHIDFASAIVLPQFMECDEVMEQLVWKCETCNNLDICKSCAILCHRGHHFKYRWVKQDLKLESVQCNCHASSSTCLFKMK